MKILRLKLINYIGIHNGLGLNKIDIDLSKSTHKIMMIKGKNGSGKSTLFNALNLFPDNASEFIPDKPAEKEIDLWDNGIIYHIKFKHSISNSGKRETSKSYISKQIDDNNIELNPNGNLSTYKDILYSELKLDANFISLSQLSSDDKGIVHKKPSERKKFVNNIIGQLSTYNMINKTLTKRSSIFKSLINSITAKIDLIGDKGKVNMDLKSTENRLSILLNKKDKLINLRSSNSSKISLLDPDKRLQKIGKEILDSFMKLKNDEEDINKKINDINTENISDKDIYNLYSKTNNNIIELESKIKSIGNNIKNNLKEKEIESKELEEKKQTLNTLTNNIDYNELKNILDISKSNIKEYKSIINKIGITDIDSISKDEFIMGLNCLKDIKELASSYTSNEYLHELKISIEYVKENHSVVNDIEKLEIDISNLEVNKNNLTTDLQVYSNLMDISKKLSLRPSNCNINNCGFIKDALRASNKNPEDNIKRIESKLEQTEITINKLKKQKEELNRINIIMSNIKLIIRTIKNNMPILRKLPINISIDDILYKVLNNIEFKEFDELYKYIDYANIIDEYKAELKSYEAYHNQYELYKNKNVIIKSISIDIDNINTKISCYNSKTDSLLKDLDNSKSEFNDKMKLSSKLDKLISLYDNRKTIIDKKKEVISRYNTVKTNLRTIQDCINNINAINNDIDNLNKEINPLIEEKDKLKHNLYLLDQYDKELKTYSLKYKKIELIKKYSSPSKGGIQLLFMKLYMNKTISLANKLLSLLFDGEFAIQKYIITDKEFRIPVSGSGYMHDDISSMSGGETSMISMIISFVLLQQSSTKYNILKLDEIDAPLDNDNRLNFLSVLDKLMDILEVEQCIMISHNEEIDLSNCDIIRLRYPVEDLPQENIIYDYQKDSQVV